VKHIVKHIAKHSNCDALSRLPHEDSKIGSGGEIYSLSAIDKVFPYNCNGYRESHFAGPGAKQSIDWVMMGRSEVSTEDLKPCSLE